MSVLLPSDELLVQAAVVGAPGREAAALAVKLISEIYVGFAVEKVAKVQARPLQMDGVDLEVTPV